MNFLNKLGYGIMIMGMVFPIFSIGIFLDTSGNTNLIWESVPIFFSFWLAGLFLLAVKIK